MKKTLHILTTSFIMFTLFMGAQIAGAQEWKFLSNPQKASIQGLQDQNLKTPSQLKGLSNLRFPMSPSPIELQVTRNQVQLDRTKNPLEFSGHNSWSPLPSSPGNQNFTLFSF